MRCRPARWLAVAVSKASCPIGAVCVALVMTVVSGASVARASEPATAQALFDQGRKLMAQERWPEACAKLEESQRLDPAGGTLLHLALCREHEGRIATAWARYQDALAQAKRDARKDRAKIAQDRIDVLAPRLPRMRVRVAIGNRRAEGFTLMRDDVAVGEAQWSESLPVDPGAHVLEARASGRKTWSARVDVPARAQELVIDVPELAVADAEPSRTSERLPDGAPPPGRLDEDRGDAQRMAGVIAAGIGLAGVAVGSVFGLVSISKNSEADDACAPPDRTRCSATGISAASAATSAGNVSTVSFLAGGALLATGLTLYFTAPSGRTVALAPSAGPHGASLALSVPFF